MDHFAQAPLPVTRRSVLIRATRWSGGVAGLGLLTACAGTDIGTPVTQAPPAIEPAPAPAAQPLTSGPPVALILPLSAQGNAAAVAQSLRNAAELALAETGQPAITLLVKDDGGTAQGARAAAQAAVSEGARAILGPLFSHAVGPVGQVARAQGIPVIAFSTDTNVAAAGVYLLSFLPQSDVERIIRFSAAQGRRSFIGLIPDNPYGLVAQGAFQQAVSATGGRVIVLERYTSDAARMASAVRNVAAVAAQADAIFIPDTADATPQMVQQLVAAGLDLKKVRPLGTGLWDDPRLFARPQMEGAQFAGAEAGGWRSFSDRYRARYGADPLRMATLSYDAVSLVSAIVRSRGIEGLNDVTLTNASGFNGVDGIFRFRPDGTNERGLAVMEIKNGAATVVSPAPRSF